MSTSAPPQPPLPSSSLPSTGTSPTPAPPPAPPPAVADWSRWRDVTSLFQQAAAQLTNKNPMIFDQAFSLHDSMSATEIMDPKTDQCFGIDGSKELKELVRPAFPSDYSFADALSLLATMLSNEIAFIDGASLAESTHQILFSWEDSWKFITDSDNASPRSSSSSSGSGDESGGNKSLPLIKKVIYLYSLSQQRSVDYFMKSIMDADIFEDEDFHQCNLSVRVSREIDDAFILDSLNKLIQEISELSQDGGAVIVQLVSLLRLRQELHSFSKAYFETIHFAPTGLNIYNPKELSEILRYRTEAVIIVERLIVQIRSFVSALNEANTVCASASDEIVVRSPRNAFASDGTAAKLTSTAPKRTIVFKSLKDSLKHLITLSSELTEVGNWIVGTAAEIDRSQKREKTHLIEKIYKNGDITLETFINYAIAFSTKKTHLLTRSFYFSSSQILYHDLPHVIRLSFGMRSFPSDLLAMDVVNNKFINSLQIISFDTFRCFSAHRNKVLVKLGRLLPVFAELMEEANFIDLLFIRLINGLPMDLSVPVEDTSIRFNQQWMYYYSALISIKLVDVRMGLMIEYALISPKEMDMFYWYWDYTCNIFIYAANMLTSLRQEHYNRCLYIEISKRREAQMKALKDSGKHSVKSFKLLNSAENEEKLVAEANSKLKATAMMPPPRNEHGEIEDASYVEVEFMRGKMHLCKSIFRIFSYYAKCGVIDKSENRFSSWEGLINMRFDIALPGFGPITYNDFLKALHCNKNLDKIMMLREDRHITELDASTLIDMICNLLDQSKKSYEDLKKSRVLPSAAAGNNAVIITKSAAAGGGGGGGGGPTFAFQRSDQSFLDAIMPVTKVIVSLKINFSKLQQEFAKNELFKPPGGKLLLDYKFNPNFPVASLSSI